MVFLTRIEHFNAAHKLYNPAWAREKNEEVFGACANENWHGHNYELYVTIKGEPDPETGFLMDVKKLSEYHQGPGNGKTGSQKSEYGSGFPERENVFDRKPGHWHLESTEGPTAGDR